MNQPPKSAPTRSSINSGATRRDMLKASSLAGVTFAFAPGIAKTYAANEKLRMASIGAGGQASGGVSAGLGQHLVAVAEVDQKSRGAKNLENVAKRSPDTKIYSDFRKLFDKHAELDAVCIGTPDHTHFPASIRALHAGAGVYCEKPLTWSIWEARKIRALANTKRNQPTQMGNQGHSSDSIRQMVEHVRGGSLGKVSTVYTVSNRRFSAGSRSERPKPEGLDWEAWLGPAPYRDYHGGLHPFAWRGWLDFGTGSLGDMGCHTIDGAVWALKLYECEQFDVEPVHGKNTKEGFAPQAEIRYSFPARGDMPACTMTWYHGGPKPPRPQGWPKEVPMISQGSYFLSEDGKGGMTAGSHCQGCKLFPAKLAEDVGKPEPLIDRVKGGHRGDWLNAVKEGKGRQPSSSFDYAGRLTEIVLIGNLAVTFGQKLTYNMKTGKITNHEKANALLSRPPRKGWEFGYEGKLG